MRPTSATVIGLGVLAFLWATPAAAQDSMTVCAGPNGQLRKIEEGASCRRSETGPFTLQGGGGGEPAGPVNYAWTFEAAGSSAMPAACTNQLIVSVPVPADAPDGLLAVRGKHRVNISHQTSPGDSGYLVWSGSPITCGAADTERSHFEAPEFDLAAPRYEMTVFTQKTFPASGGDIVDLYLNSVMVSGANTPPGTMDTVGDDYVIVEFHVNPPAP